MRTWTRWRPAVGSPAAPRGWATLTRLRRFLRTETGGAAALVAVSLAGIVWANLGSSYHEVWDTPVALAVGDEGIHLSLRECVNSGLMTFFFFVVGLEPPRGGSTATRHGGSGSSRDAGANPWPTARIP
jgi:hypothetical protein